MWAHTVSIFRNEDRAVVCQSQFVPEHVPFALIGDGKVQQLNVHDYYELGKKVHSIEREMKAITEVIAASTLAWPLFMLRWHFVGMLTDPCALLPASQRAALAVMKAIGNLVPADIDGIFKLTPEDTLSPYQFHALVTAITEFETVLKNYMPEMSTFAVDQIGIFRTEDLINKPFNQISEDLRSLLLPLALKDISEAGKCLAFRVPTAAAFHLSRAIERGMSQYYEGLTGEPYQLPDAARNWAKKTEALEKADADKKITEYLVHIRKAYRNPITHPDEILDSSEAFNFFSQAIGVISMMLTAVKLLDENKQPLLPGIIGTVGVRSSDNLLALNTGTLTN